MNLTSETLKCIATGATTLLAGEYELYGFAAAAPTITPAMVRTIIAVLETIADAPDTTPSPSGEDHAGVILTSPRRLREQRAAVSEDAIFAAIRALAVDNIMPSQVHYNLHRPIGYPSDAQIRKRLKLTWRKLGFKLNLVPNRQFDHLTKPPPEEAAAPAEAAPFSVSSNGDLTRAHAEAR